MTTDGFSLTKIIADRTPPEPVLDFLIVDGGITTANGTLALGGMLFDGKNFIIPYMPSENSKILALPVRLDPNRKEHAPMIRAILNSDIAGHVLLTHDKTAKTFVQILNRVSPTGAFFKQTVDKFLPLLVYGLPAVISALLVHVPGQDGVNTGIQYLKDVTALKGLDATQSEHFMYNQSFAINMAVYLGQATQLTKQLWSDQSVGEMTDRARHWPKGPKVYQVKTQPVRPEDDAGYDPRPCDYN